MSGGGNPVYSFNKNVNYDYNGVSALKGIGTNLLGSNPNTTTNVISAATYRVGGAVNVLNYGNGRRLTMGYYQQRSQPASMKVDLASNPADKIIDYSYDYWFFTAVFARMRRRNTLKTLGKVRIRSSHSDENRCRNLRGCVYILWSLSVGWSTRLELIE